MPVLLDVESRSRADLKKVGGRRYWKHPSSEVLCCCWYDTRTGELGDWRPGQDWPHHGRRLAAHNASGFDRFAGDRLGWISPGGWIDTSELARTVGLAGALDRLGQQWFGIPKDKEGSRLTVSLSTCRRPAGKGPDAIPAADWARLTADEKRERGVQKTITPEILARVVQYCYADVEIIAEAWPHLKPWQDLEPDVLAAHRAINERGVCFDVDLARALLRCDEANADRVVTQAAREMPRKIDARFEDIELWRKLVEFGPDPKNAGLPSRPWTPAEVRAAARSVSQFREITGAPNARKADVEKLDHPLARARLALTTIASGKLEAGLARVCPDGRLRDAHKYYGGHTGRWSGVGFQPQNLPRPDDLFEDWADEQIHRLAFEVMARRHLADPAEIDLLLRACLCASPGKRLVVRDFKGVEARALAWTAGDHAALDVFASGADPYLVMASAIYGEPVTTKGERRTIGKIAELACGYQGATDAFTKMAGLQGVDLTGVDVPGVVQAWRRKHAPCVRLWRALDNAWATAFDGRKTTVADLFTLAPSDDGRDVVLWLPSGRPIVYNDARITACKKGGALAYRGTSLANVCPKCGYEHTYGGKLTENAIQAMCRDLLAAAMVESERVGLRPVLSVHDELVCEVDKQATADAAGALQEIMTDLPDWADGLPIGADGFEGRRYRK